VNTVTLFVSHCRQRASRLSTLRKAMESAELDPFTGGRFIAIELEGLAAEAELVGLPRVHELAAYAAHHYDLAIRDVPRGRAPLSPDFPRALTGLASELVLAHDTTRLEEELERLRRELEGALSDSPSEARDSVRIGSPDGATRATRLIVLDDSPIIRDILSTALRSHGYDVRTAANLTEFDQAFAVFRPDVVITDVIMPEAEGDALCRMIKARMMPKLIPIVLVSSMPDEELALRAREAGADGYVSKKAGVRALNDELDRLLSEILI
jgi:CheY-like chemotaxis protein